MKHFLLLIISLLCIGSSFAQDTIEKKNRLSNAVTERFMVLKNDQQQTKTGAYKAYYNRKVLVAAGNYTKGEKSGIWNFYDRNGKPAEKFDYDKSEFEYEAPVDTTGYMRYGFDEVMSAQDRLTRPLRIGGSYYGFIPFVNAFRLPFATYDVDTNYFTAVVELLISPGGKLADYKVHINSDEYEYRQTFSFDVNLFSFDDKAFVPATLNHRPILSRIFIRCSVESDGGLDFF